MKTMTLELPINLYEQLQALSPTESDLVKVISQLVMRAYQQRAWLQDLEALRQQICQDGGLKIGTDKQQVVETLRQTRYEIFEAEYAHLYR